MKVTIEVPDAWISEDNVLCLVHQHAGGLTALAERANSELAAWGYPHRFDASTLLAARERLWVDPAFIMSEVWPKSAVTPEQRAGWVRVLRIDLDAVGPGSIEPVHWVGDAPTSLHGNGAASFERTTREHAEVTCSLCLTLLDRESSDPS